MHHPHLPSLSRRERGLLFAFLALLLVALLCPAVPMTDAAASLFADGRAWHGLPNALDVLSNLPFLALGIWGLRRLHRLDRSRERAQPLAEPPANTLDCAWLFFAGLIATACGSIFFHLQPDDLRLAADRAGMTLAFAGLVGLAVCERVSQRAGWLAAWIVLGAGLLAVAVWHESANIVPWALVQFGGMALVLTLALARPMPEAAGLKLGWVVFFYALAKLFELGDHAIYEATAQLVSGHSLKHLTAALAALPVLQALRRLGPPALRHNSGAAVVA
jgi:hypothetical protein